MYDRYNDWLYYVRITLFDHSEAHGAGINTIQEEFGRAEA